MRVTRKAILNAVCTEFNIKPEYIEMERFDGAYCWSGKLAACFDSTEAINKLTDWSIERWKDDFALRLESIELGDFPDYNAYVESLDWDVEYED